MTEPVNPPGGKSQRPCPALQGPISPADCGARRSSQLACPISCPFYPFGPQAFKQWLKIDASWARKTGEYLSRQLGVETFQRRLRAATVPLGNRGLELESAFHQVLVHGLFRERRKDGRSLANRWEVEGWKGLNNDERVMMKHRQHTSPAVLEVVATPNELATRCVDLFDPERVPFEVLDPGLAAGAIRFSRILTWVVHYGPYSRVAGTAIYLPYAIWTAWREKIEERYHAVRATHASITLKDHLAATMPETIRLVGELDREHHRRTQDEMKFHRCIATYKLVAAKAEVEASLERRPEFDKTLADEDPAFARPEAFYRWLPLGESSELASELSLEPGLQVEVTRGGEAFIANVRLYPDRLLVETFSRPKHDAVRRLMGRFFGEKISFDEEHIVDLAKALREERMRYQTVRAAQQAAAGSTIAQPEEAQATSYSTSPLEEAGRQRPSPRTEQEIERLAVRHRRRYEMFLDEKVARLDGRTLREAAAEAALRPRLVELLKGHVHHLLRKNRAEGLNLSLDWLLDELGIPELK